MTGVVLVNDSKEFKGIEYGLLRSSLRISFFDAIAMKVLLCRQWNAIKLAGRIDKVCQYYLVPI